MDDHWRGSAGSLDRVRRSPDLLVFNRPVSATPPEKHLRIRRRTGLRKRFLSLTEGIASLITRDKREKSVSSLKNESESPKRLRKSIFYVDHRDCADTTPSRGQDAQGCTEIRDAPRGSSSPRPWPRLTRSMSHGNGTTGGIKSVKAPPSPPPRRYTLWGLSPPYELENELHTAPMNMRATFNDTKTDCTADVRSQLARFNPSSSSRVQYEQIHGPSTYSASFLTPPNSPLISPRSWAAQYPPTLSCNIIDRNERNPCAPNFKFYSTMHDQFTEESPYSLNSLFNMNQYECPIYADTLAAKSTCSTFSRTSPLLDRKPQKCGLEQTSGAISQDCKSSLFGLGSYRGDWYRRKAAKARRSTPTRRLSFLLKLIHKLKLFYLPYRYD